MLCPQKPDRFTQPSGSSGFSGMGLLVPGPGGANDRLKIRVSRPEFQDLARGGRVGNQIGGIARATRLYDVRHFVTGFRVDRRENLSHRKAVAGAKIEDAARMSTHQEPERR